MRKIYLLFAVLISGFAANAQNDISVSLNNYTDGEATSDDPLDLVFTITNNGATVPTGDTIFFTFLIGTTNYSMNLTSGSVSYIKLTADWATGAANAIDLSMLTTPPSTMTSAWLYSEFGNDPNPAPLTGFSGNVCAFAVVGEDGLQLNAANDASYLDNFECVDYTVDQSSFGENDLGTISVYPNPATSEINFNLGNNEVDFINILDISGRIIDVITVTGNTEGLSLSSYENGVYFYQIVRNDEAVKTEKFVVSK